ncbi:porin [Celeribacter marinus]|uniref:Porin n=1 Tax=Celeribacter marinus TaxID=1397108 RepID=A0A0N7HIQ2_9RHOB|nr:porin [Celeribacter marinus]ALI55853.1 porin [Celeribacter marinus]SFK89875.1 porin [Celeribacter marinus]
MQWILLSSVAIVAFAGAAAAEISFSGAGTLGYNDDFEDGVYVDVDVDMTATAELNNGWTATVTYGVELDDNGAAGDFDVSGDDNLKISLSNASSYFTYGDTKFAAESKWSGVSEMAQDGFSEQDGEAVLIIGGTFGGVEAAASAGVDETTGETYQVGFGAKATFGTVDLSVAYQEEDAAITNVTKGDYKPSEIFAISAGTSFAGADVKVAYASNQTADENSLGLEVGYPVGPVALGAFYVAESAGDDTYGLSAVYSEGALTAKAYYKNLTGSDEYGIGATYDMGNGLKVSGGYADGDSVKDDDFAAYVVADYDLGGGASFIAAYADYTGDAAVDISTDDIDTVTGGYELRSGATLALSLKF